MRTRLAIAGLVAVGALLMANPLYLPVAIGEPDPVYTHTVQPVDDGSPIADADDTAVDTATVAYENLTDDARAAFDRANRSPDNGFGVDDPNDRVGSLPYPTSPVLGDGLLVVVHEDERYEFWTRTIERESSVVVAQRVVVQPVAFLVGFLGIVAAGSLAIRSRNEIDDENSRNGGGDGDSNDNRSGHNEGRP